jgi:hypothetical protein
MVEPGSQLKLLPVSTLDIQSVSGHLYAVHGHMALASNSYTPIAWVIFWGSGSLVESK